MWQVNPFSRAYVRHALDITAGEAYLLRGEDAVDAKSDTSL